MKSLIIVGPGKHFGKEIALRFSQEGFHVGLIGRDKSKLTLLKKSLSDKGVKCDFALADVIEVVKINEAIKCLYEKLPSIKCIVYNVKASFSIGDIKKNSNVLIKDLETNVVGAWNTIESILHIVKKDFPVTLIVTGGGYKDNSDYKKLGLSVSKAALHNLVIAFGPLLMESNIFLKILVIDGLVREQGPIFPEDVAEQFWGVYNSSKDEFIFRHP